jgi:hypothetical protein
LSLDPHNTEHPTKSLYRQLSKPRSKHWQRRKITRPQPYGVISANIVISTIVYLIPWHACNRPFEYGTLRSRMWTGSTELRRSRSIVFSAVTISSSLTTRSMHPKILAHVYRLAEVVTNTKAALRILHSPRLLRRPSSGLSTRGNKGKSERGMNMRL